VSNVRDVRSKPIPIMLDKQRHMKFDLNAFAEIEEQYGSVEAAMDALEQGSIKALRIVLWAGLIHEELDDKGEAKITPKFIGSLISIQDLPSLVSKIGEAMNVDMGEIAELASATGTAKAAAVEEDAAAPLAVPQKETSGTGA